MDREREEEKELDRGREERRESQTEPHGIVEPGPEQEDAVRAPIEQQRPS